MHIHHVATATPLRATCRVRMALPGKEMVSMGHRVTMGLRPIDGAINVWHKWSKRWDLSEFSGDWLDISDDWTRAQSIEKRAGFTLMVETAGHISASSRALASRFNARYIPDAVEGNRMEPRWLGVNTCLWYGHPDNLPTLSLLNPDIPLEIVTDPSAPAAAGLTVTPWSAEVMPEVFARHDITVIPQWVDGPASLKSNNRMTLALWHGVAVVASPTEANRELSEFAFVTDDIDAGVEQARSNPARTVEMIRAGQDYIARHYSPRACAEQWLAMAEGIQA